MTAISSVRANALAAKVSQSMSGSGELVVLDSETRSWNRCSWQEVHARAEAIAEDVLSKAQDQVGVVGLVGEPTVDLVAAVQAAWLAGTSVSIFPGPTRGANPRQWAQSTLEKFAAIGATTVYSHGQELGLLRAAAAPVLVEDLVKAGARRRSASFVPVLNGDDETPAVLQSTAGSTGTPKTAVISRRAVMANITAGIDAYGLREGSDRICSWLPLYHDMGLGALFLATLTGIPFWLASNTAFASGPLRWLDWLTESRATITPAPNFAYDIIGRFGKRIEGVDLSSVRIAISGGEPISCDGLERFLAATAPFGFDPAAATPAYGLAESSCGVTTSVPGSGARYDEVVLEVSGGSRQSTRRYAVLGTPLRGMEVRVTPSTAGGFEGSGREVGEVEVRGSSMMSGYLGDSEASPDEWFRTGDLGYLVNGELVVVGRSKELIVIAGRNIFPVEIERVVEQVEGVRGGGVAAVSTGERSARPGLVIALEYKGSDESSARSQVIERVASECGVVPADVVFLQPGYLPRTTSGKLRRFEVKRYLEHAGETI